jgi:hypothetical protein
VNAADVPSYVALAVTLAAVVSVAWDYWDRAEWIGGDDE